MTNGAFPSGLADIAAKLAENGDLRGILESVMSRPAAENVEFREKNPDEGNMRSDSGLKSEFSQAASSPAVSQDNSGEGNSFPDLSGLMSMITPEMMKALPSVLSALGGGDFSSFLNGQFPNFSQHSDNKNCGNADHNNSETHEKNNCDTHSEDHHHKKCSAAQRRALLTALRPFLSDSRCRALDMMIGIEQLGLFGGSKEH